MFLRWLVYLLIEDTGSSGGDGQVELKSILTRDHLDVLCYVIYASHNKERRRTTLRGHSHPQPKKHLPQAALVGILYSNTYTIKLFLIV